MVLAGLIKANGEFSKDVVAYSDDAAGILEIPMKTRAFDGLGAVITFLSLLKTETINLTAPATGNILAAYDLGPAATVFLPVVKFSITYPAGYTPGSGDYMAWWNGTDWVPLPSAVNTANGTMTALVSHFSRFALISLGQGQAAASATEFKVSELTLSPGSAAPHQVVLASVLVTNTQAQAGSGTVVLKLNGTTLATIDLTLAGDTSRRLIFSLAGPEPGTYEVAVNDASAVFKVSAP